MLLARKSVLKPTDKLFRLSADQFRQQWHRACDDLRWWPGPPHSLRHNGPSQDALEGYRTLDAIR
eukprot:6928799-Alexandrium_andersonii.AAC.1